MANFRLCLYLALCGIALISSNANDCFEEDVAYPGNGLKKMKASSPQDCRIACQQTDGCEAFTFREKSKKVKNCFLKDSKLEKETGVATSGATSGDRNCVIHCEWDEWAIGECSDTCGTGTRTNTRTKSVEEANGGTCTGQPSEIEECNTDPCPIDCEWDEWQVGQCDKTCGGGLFTKTRVPKVDEQHGGEECTGHASITESCNVQECPVDCQWRDWSEWGDCSQTCGGGVQIASREKEEELFGGIPCDGEAIRQQDCNPDQCPKACVNTDDGATDQDGDGCNEYTRNPTYCGGYDDDDFFSYQMCCACVKDGRCRYGNKYSDFIGDVVVSSVQLCNHNCRSLNECTAYAFDPTTGMCLRYRGGPYTHGDEAARYKCYIRGHDPSQCLCKALISSGDGNCQTTSSQLNNLPFCYVVQPSTCTDLQNSRALPGEKFSAEACSNTDTTS